MNLNKILIAILIIAFIFRLIPQDFPKFTSDEARIAYRGYSLATSGKDELGRTYPFIFNSSYDYQLPVVSYLTVLGELIFGKNDFGARIPFVLLSLAIILIVYKIAYIFDQRKWFSLFTALIVAFSPTLIFLSKVPNETILLTFNFSLLFYLLVKKNPNVFLIFLVILLSFLSSKFAWFTLLPFVLSTLHFPLNNFIRKDKIKILLTCLFLTLSTFIVFLQIPQGKRSLIENNFSIFNEISIKNGIDKLRGQGIQSNWPPILEKMFFNKLHFFSTGFLNWISQIHPISFFGYLDKNPYGYLNSGSLAKILIIPFILGLIYMIKKADKRSLLLIISVFILTVPSFFAVSMANIRQEVIVLPFIALITSLGLISITKWFRWTIIVVFLLEVVISTSNINANIKVNQQSRPFLIKEIIVDSMKVSEDNKIGFSDNLAEDIAPFIQWYAHINSAEYKDITFPYKFKQSQLNNIKIIGTDSSFYKCGHDKPTNIVASKRDKDEIGRWLNIKTEEVIKKVYKNREGNEVAYLFESKICVH